MFMHWKTIVHAFYIHGRASPSVNVTLRGPSVDSGTQPLRHVTADVLVAREIDLSALYGRTMGGDSARPAGASPSAGILVTWSRTSRKGVSVLPDHPFGKVKVWHVERRCVFPAPALPDVVFKTRSDADLSHHCEDVHEVIEGRTRRDEAVHHVRYRHFPRSRTPTISWRNRGLPFSSR